MLKIPIIAILLALTLAWKDSNTRQIITQQHTKFTGLLVLRWPGGFCQYLQHQNHACNPQQFLQWDTKSFTIRSLWPSHRTDRPYHNYKVQHVHFHLHIRDRMQNFWPDFCHHVENQTSLDEICSHSSWQNLYNTYGKDYAHMLEMSADEDQLLHQQKLQQSYFDNTIKKYEVYFNGLQKIKRNESLEQKDKLLFQKQQLADLINIKSDEMVVKCVQQGHILYELQICVEFDYDQMNVVKCSEVEADSKKSITDTCSTKIQLYSYGQHQQVFGRVMQYEPRSQQYLTKKQQL